jgi:peptide/nickel transport system permease protein
VATARREPGACFGLLLICFLVAAALLAPYAAPYKPQAQVGAPFGHPSLAHPLGLDDAGEDVLSLLMWGARISLLVGFAATLVAVVIGGAIGIVAGYFGGMSEIALMRVTDYFLAIPVIPLMIVVAALWGSTLRNIILIIGLLSWCNTARVVRSQVITIRRRAYVVRARAVGARTTRIVLTHIVPQVTPLLVALAAITVGGAIFAEAALAFLGLGDPTLVSWGQMIAIGFQRSAVSSGAWWAIVPPGICIGLAVLGCSLVGRALEDRLNPRLGLAHIGTRTFRMSSGEIDDP